MTNYDRRAASPRINRLTPLAASVAEDYRRAVTSLEQAIRTLQLIEKEAQESVPKSYTPRWGTPTDPFWAVWDNAKSLREEIEKRKLMFDKGHLGTWVDEFASETRAHHGE